ncbi:sigma factor RpoE negative regulatory protein RseA [Halorhodospira halochloris]|uniref:Sigma factor RpoE negative regulatory protein RseA n=1 Tax=Halorhodospira halochloris TaxID=1052 RepID=A0A125T2P9_HALHR|nr:sigma-E factor negative regulatory protein [Halorhodospira halochloris]MBK1652018.1 hypothetical protein [Halorhodospira halochloris]MCG5547884.1 sigma-E factor negative regulatory protein [Halorhodospira halochloris]BAU58316.1 sigma factor RpoE negative regulatory protein RseA [Halorhodospira halochloris]
MSTKDEQDRLDEQLSALVDGELSKEEQAFVLRRIGHDRSVRERLARYFVMRDALQRNLPEYPRAGLAERVHAALEHEAKPGHSGSSAFNWRRPALGGSIAASVALVSVLWWQGNMQYAGDQAGEVPQPPPAQQQADIGTESQSGRPAAEQQQPAESQAVSSGGATMPVGADVGFAEPWHNVERVSGAELERRQPPQAEQSGDRSKYHGYPGVPEVVPGSDDPIESYESFEGQRAAAP